MKREDKRTEGFSAACAGWWKSVAREARERALASMECGPVIACPGPPPGVSRLMLLATMFEPQGSLTAPLAGRHIRET